MKDKIHCQEFHELAMEYRGTQIHAASTYQRLCDYIDARIAAAGNGPDIPDGYQLVRLQQRAYQTPRGAIYGGSNGGFVPLYAIVDEVASA